MTTPEPKKGRRLTWLWVALAFFIGLVAMAGIAFLLTNIQTHKNEEVEYPLKTVAIAENELDPAVWGQNFPREYDSFKKTEIDGVETPYGGSNSYDKLAKYPILKRVWAGYAFSKDFNEERGHFYALDRSEGNQTSGCGETAGRLRQLPRRGGAAAHRRDGLGQLQQDALQGDLRHAAHGFLLRRLP